MLTSSVLIGLTFAVLVSGHIPLPVAHVQDGPSVVQVFADEPNYRLPNNTRPILYDIQLVTHIHTQTNFNFTGTVGIRFSAVTASRSITLHQRQLQIGNASLVRTSNPDQTIPLDPHRYDSVTEMLTFPLNANAADLVVNEQYILTISYEGTHRTDGGGFHRSSYISADGTRRYLATTQLETTNARHAFPCFDEPGLRALFSVRITHGSIYHAVSNMPIASKENHSNGYTTTHFNATTATMSTYLVAFLVSDFEFKSKNSSRGLEQRIFARPNAIQDGDFGLDVGIKTLDAFEKYFGLNYAFPKMDQAAIPEKGGAMENWGLVTYGENVLLYNASRSTFREMENIATIIAHEYAHQWFGNLVVCKWWNSNWLNEGFATLFENHGVDWLFPEWKKLDWFVYAVVQDTFVSDATSLTRPMTHYVQTPATISANFNFVGYAKSGCVLEMMLNAFTETTFKKSLENYLRYKSFDVAVEEDLFEQLEVFAKADRTLSPEFNVPTIFASWTRQAGFPIVDVVRNYQTGDIVLNQERYFTVNETTQSPSIWWIPYNVATASSADFESTAATSWFHDRSTTIRGTLVNSNDWLLLNKRQTGYYRVKYDLQNYKLLSQALVQNHTRIHLASRSQLIDDAFDLARTERISYQVALDFTKYLEHELEYVPWASAFRGIQLVDRLYASRSEYSKFSAYIVKQLSNLYQDAGLTANPNEHLWRKQSRNQAIHWSCRLGSALCLSETRISVGDYLVRKVAIHQDHRATILCNGIRLAGEIEYALLVLKLTTESDTTERNRLIDALACTSDATLTKMFLEATVTDSVFAASQAERYRGFSEVAGNSQNSTQLALEFLTANLDRANAQFGRTNVNRAIIRLADFVVDDERSKQFTDLLNAARPKSYIDAATITSAEVRLAENKRWIDRNAKVIEEWINANGSTNLMVSVVLVSLLLLVSQLI